MNKQQGRIFGFLASIVVVLAIFGGLYAYTVSRDNTQVSQGNDISANADAISSQGTDLKQASRQTKELITRAICSLVPDSPSNLDLATCLSYLHGDQGIAGVPGQNGIGTPGPAGLEGPRGIPGLDGINGLAGAIGALGDAGPRGPPGESIVGSDGTDGATGTSGTDGANGTNGLDGADGAQGPKGDTGPPGPPVGSFTFTYLTQTFTCTDPEGDGSYACQ